MEGARIPFRMIPQGRLLDPPPDGTYVLIAFSTTVDGVFGRRPNAFPWIAYGVRFFAGERMDLCFGTRPIQVLEDVMVREIKEVLIIGTEEMNLARLRELAEMLAVKNIELIDV